MTIAPAWPLVALAAMGVVLTFVASFDDIVATQLLWIEGFVAAVALIDLAVLMRTPQPLAQRDAPDVAPMGVPAELVLRLLIPKGRALRVLAHDEYAEGVEGGREPVPLRLVRGQTEEIRYTRTARRRGVHALGPVALGVFSPLGLWQRRMLVGDVSALKAYPNLRKLAGAAQLKGRSAGDGRPTARASGADNEFAGLREYRRDDSFRSIDWRASARKQTLVAREYRADEDQSVVLVIDRGRSMIAHDGQASLLERAIESGLSLAMLAVDRGDHVGTLVYATAVEHWLPPRRSGSAFTNLVSRLGTLEPTAEESDPLAAAQTLKERLRRRSLVVWYTRPLDSAAAEGVVRAVSLLRNQHLVLVVVVRDRELESRLAARTLDGGDGIEQVAAVADLLDEGRAFVEQLRKAGVSTLQVFPDAMDVSLINRYLDLKAVHRL
jgi:uncharacterized protein (DUF58 family)